MNRARLVLDLAHAALSAAAQRLAGSRYVSMSSRALRRRPTLRDSHYGPVYRTSRGWFTATEVTP